MATVGRPRKIKSPEQMQAIADEYFAACELENKPFTITGVALALGLCSRNEVQDYGDREEFSLTVKRIRTRCEHYAETQLYGKNVVGAIFALKNYGWTDRSEVELKGQISLKAVLVPVLPTERKPDPLPAFEPKLLESGED